MTFQMRFFYIIQDRALKMLQAVIPKSTYHGKKCFRSKLFHSKKEKKDRYVNDLDRYV